VNRARRHGAVAQLHDRAAVRGAIRPRTLGVASNEDAGADHAPPARRPPLDRLIQPIQRMALATRTLDQTIDAIACTERRCRSDTAGLRLPYLAFAETFLAGSRVDSSARLRRLLDLFEARAITGRAYNFR